MKIFITWANILWLIIVTNVFGQAQLSQEQIKLHNAIQNYLDLPSNANVTDQDEKFNLVMQRLTPGCLTPAVMMALQMNIRLTVSNIGEVYDFGCISAKIVDLPDDKKLPFLDKAASIHPSLSCQTNNDCSGDLSCLSLDESEYFENNGVKGTVLEALQQYIEEKNVSLSLAVKAQGSSCSYNFECQSFFCKRLNQATTGTCVSSKICRLGDNGDIVKANGACLPDLTKNAQNVCQGELQDNDLLPFYKKNRDAINNDVCGAFIEDQEKDIHVSKDITKLATDLRAFELMVKLAQNLNDDHSYLKGSGLNSYSLLPKKMREMFLNDYLTEKNKSIKDFNEEFQKFNKTFEELLKTNGKSTEKINLFDYEYIMKEVHEQKVDAALYRKIYKQWIELQKKYYENSYSVVSKHMIEETPDKSLFSVIDKLANTVYSSDYAPLFNESVGKDNSKRWFITLSLPSDHNKFMEFLPGPESRLIDGEILKAAQFKDTVTYAFNPIPPQVYQSWFPLPVVGQPAPRPLNLAVTTVHNSDTMLIDPILPPQGCNIINQSGGGNECGYDPAIDWTSGSPGVFENNITATLEKLYDAWYVAILKFYKEAALGQEANTIIDPELNIYAGCIQEMTNTRTSQDTLDFYKNFCIKNGENLTEKNLKMLTKKILTYSMAYSFNPYKGSKGWFAVRKNYVLEFKRNEANRKFSKPDWIDNQLPHANPSLKFYDFRYGQKKKFLNRVRNKYFFMGNFYQLMMNAFDKQLKCIDESDAFNNNAFNGTNDNPLLQPEEKNLKKTGNKGNTGNQKDDSELNKNNSGSDSHSIKKSSSTSTSTSKQYGGSGYGSNSGSNLQLSSNSHDGSGSSGNPNAINDLSKKDEKSFFVDGVSQKNESAVLGQDGNARKNGVSDYGIFGNAEEGGQQGGVVSLSDQEKEKINAAMNSSQDPSFSEDTLFTQITQRYVKSYKKIFRAERRGSAQ